METSHRIPTGFKASAALLRSPTGVSIHPFADRGTVAGMSGRPEHACPQDDGRPFHIDHAEPPVIGPGRGGARRTGA